MPYSYSKFKHEVKHKIVQNISHSCRVLDVGAGSGCYGEMLLGHFETIDAIEIFPNYIKIFELENKYNNVIQGDILNFNFTNYDFIIMGDVLEHLKVEDAKNIIRTIQSNRQAVLVAVPYMFEQGEEYGNIYETHHQPDLTPEVMAERYPELKLIYGDQQYGYYVNSFFCESCY